MLLNFDTTTAQQKNVKYEESFEKIISTKDNAKIFQVLEINMTV